jgi:homoserine O-succinyltransferase/O-acetyltransferase
MNQKKLRLAILDLYDGTPNQGMRCIQEILAEFSSDIEFEIFDVRQKTELPNLDFDIYISSGGPGDPREGNGIWDKKWNDWVHSVMQFNKNAVKNDRKHVFFICHSFQMACIHFNLAKTTPRKSMSFGTFPVYMTPDGCKETNFDALENPFYIADFRRFQVVQADETVFKKMNAKILAREKPRPHVPLERAIMAIRFSNEMIGTQFHPEADGDGMLDWFLQEDKKTQIIEEHGIERYNSMIKDLSDPKKIEFTQKMVLPTFLKRAIASLGKRVLAASC